MRDEKFIMKDVFGIDRLVKCGLGLDDILR